LSSETQDVEEGNRMIEKTTISVGLRDMVRYEDMPEAVARIEEPMGARVTWEEEAGL
jgi:hypothetical protein